MKIPKFFDQKDFLMNDEWKVTILPLFNSHVIFVDDIYKHPERVHEWLDEAPIVSLKPPTADGINGKEFMDGQKYGDFRFDPTRTILFKHITDFYKIKDPEVYGTNPISIYNQFRLIEPFGGEPYCWSPHVDNKLNVCIYLNPDENYTPGTSFYDATELGNEMLHENTEHVLPWKDEKYFVEKLCILSKFNSLVAFPGQWPHGQTIVDNRWQHKTRFTEVSFF